MARGKIFRKKAKKHSNELSSNTVFAQKKVTSFKQNETVENDDGESGGGQGKRLLGFYKKEKVQRLVTKKLRIKDFLPFLNKERMAGEVTKSPVSKDSKKNHELREQAKVVEEAERRVAELQDDETADSSAASTRTWGKESNLANTEVNVAAQAFGRSLEGAFVNVTQPANVAIAGHLKAHAMFGSSAPGAITHGTINPLGFSTLETIANAEAVRQKDTKFVNTNAAMLRQKNTTFVNVNAAFTRQKTTALNNTNAVASMQKNAALTQAQANKKVTPSGNPAESPSLSAKGRR